MVAVFKAAIHIGLIWKVFGARIDFNASSGSQAFPESDGRIGDVIYEDVEGKPVQDFAATVEKFLNSRRSEICPEEPSVHVTVHGPCTSEVISGIQTECILTMAAGEETANRRVRMVEAATGGIELYFHFDKDDPEEHFCQGLFSSTFVLDESEDSETSSLLESLSASDSTAEVSSEYVMRGGGWLGHDAEMDYLQMKLLAEHGEELPPGHPAARLQVLTEPQQSSYGQDPRNVPGSFSVISDFNAGKDGSRRSAECFPGGGLARKPGGGMVTNQGECGSCWAQAGSGVVSDRMCLAGIPGMGGHGLNRTLSVQHVLSCGDFPGGVDPCVGGIAALYFDFAIQKGIAKRKDSPYTMKCPRSKTNPHAVVAPEAMGINCNEHGPESQDAPGMSEFKCICVKPQSARPQRHDSCPVATRNVEEVYKIQSFKRTPYPGEPWGTGGQTWSIADVVLLYKKELFANGPFFVGFQTFSDFMAHFKERKVYIHNPQSQLQGGHAVQLTGWGTHKQLPYRWQCKARGTRQGRPHHGQQRPSRPLPPGPVRHRPPMHFAMYAFGGRNVHNGFQPQGPVHVRPPMHHHHRPTNPGPAQMGPRQTALPDTPSKVPDEVNYVADCSKEIVVNYWELRNSWGTDWGDNGYFYMRSGYNEVGLESSGRVPQVDIATAGPFDAKRASPQPRPQKPNPTTQKCSGKGKGCQVGNSFFAVAQGYSLNEHYCRTIMHGTWCP
eukprot:TRINITY_DN58372_c0_g1_i1.p1 TRINITY_DN58372_c0_g1~~TRINITY_DN58372_c0_g1_i1.p1  ORF type:complete len:724 (+),score=87.86 TRINITY_DN58372_c0_g1_i1:102-2273(+)